MEVKCKTEVKLFYGKCACCSEYGYLKPMWQEFNWKGKVEIYARMIIECFGLEVWYTQGDDESICDTCIMSLRDACAFKSIIMDAQLKLGPKTDVSDCDVKETQKDGINNVIKSSPKSPVTSDENTETKTEITSPVMEFKQHLSSDSEAYDIEYIEEDLLDDGIGVKKDMVSDSDEIVVQNVYTLVRKDNRPRKRRARKSTITDYDENSESSQSTTKWPKKLPPRQRNKTYKQYTADDMTNCLKDIKSKKMTPKEAAEFYNIPHKTIANKIRAGVLKSEKFIAPSTPIREFINEIKTILIYTNATPFKSRFNDFYCAFCSDDPPNVYGPDDLRLHTENDHPDKIDKIEFMLRPYYYNSMLKIDIRNLKCNVCDQSTVHWSAMLEHLEKKHDLKFKMARTNMVPYILNDVLNIIQCAICNQEFTAFTSVDAHMNTHYSNYSCSECGDTFITLVKLKAHEKIHMKYGRIECPVCKKAFTSETNKLKHINYYHSGEVRNYKCQYCNEYFEREAARNNHIVDNHAEFLKVINCEICGAIFYFNRTYMRHKRRRHGKTNYCNKCDKNFDTPTLLQQHKLKMKCKKKK